VIGKHEWIGLVFLSRCLFSSNKEDLVFVLVHRLTDEKIVSRSRKQYITTLIIHEIAHQWFRNLVTPAWWNEL